MHLDVRGFRAPRVWAVAVLCGAVLAACSSGGSSKPAENLAPEDTATATLTLAGDSSIAGSVADPIVNCSYPTLDGVRITASGQPQDPASTVALTIAPKSVTVTLQSGTGPRVYQRVFTGSGVTGFDAARGATLDSSLRETHPAGAVPGTIGALTRVHGTVDCGNQNVGTSTVTVTGKTGVGTLTGPLESVRVACFVSGEDNYVVIRGIGKVGTKRAEVFVNAQPARFIVGVEPAGGQRLAFASDPYATSLPTDVGANVKGDAVEGNDLATGGPTLHVEGGAKCGNAPSK
jgi:hypothetical protein